MFDRLSDDARSLVKNIGQGEDMPWSWQRPTTTEHGDLSLSVALQLSRSLKRNPREIADEIAKGLRDHADVEKVEVAGAGYVNIWLTPKALIEALSETRKACVPKKKHKKDAPTIIEYSQPNIAKPLAVHHLLSTVIGQAISNLYEHAGANVIRWNYLGDWGTQFGKLAVAMEKWGKKEAKDCTLDDLLELYVKFHEEVEKDVSLEEAGREAARKLEQGNAKLRAFWSDVVTVTKASLVGLYSRLHVQFDLDLGESFYEDKMEPVLTEGKKKKVFIEGEGGALIAVFPEETNMPPFVIVRGDGGTLYSTRDLAQMRYRIDTYHPAAIFIITDYAQKLHFEQLTATCLQLGWELPEFENVLVGRMRFPDKSMSTRKGNVLKLEDVLDEAVKRADKTIEEHRETIQTDDRKELSEMMGIGAVVYGILSQNRKMDMVFEWDKALSFEGNSAPYLQYTHARARSVLRKAEIEKAPKAPTKVALEPNERALIAVLLQFAAMLDAARSERLPHTLAHFLYRLSQEFNTFYNVLPILKAEGSSRDLRLSLTELTADVLRAGTSILTMRVPDRM